MRFYRYWVRKEAEIEMPDGTLQHVTVHGHSNESEAAAEASVGEYVEWVRNRIWGGKPSRLEESYEKPIREEIVRELSTDDIVTCNRYGALVLNTTSVIFVDVDFEGYKVPRKLSFWQRMFTSQLYRQATPEEAVAGVFDTARRLLKDSYTRVYLTCKGMRLLIVEDSYKPGTLEFNRVMKVFKADRLYARLCVQQGCSRARLTPKPYRMHIQALKHVWPRTYDEETQVQLWRSGYVERSKDFAVCRFMGEVGVNRRLHQEIIDYHDQMTKAFANLPLA